VCALIFDGAKGARDQYEVAHYETGYHNLSA
jgi:hypothetical protein